MARAEGKGSVFDFRRATRNVGGWLTKAEGVFLYHAAKNVKPGQVIVEIGSWKGRSTICLGSGSADGNKVKVYANRPACRFT
jgi:predicted O-methyltransferase YrrM